MNMLYAMVGAVFMVGMGVFAFLKGDNPERIGAGAYLMAWFASVLTQGGMGASNIPYAMFALDVVVLTVFVGLAWKSRRTWPVWASGLQLLSVMSHILIMIDTRLPITSLYTVMNLNGYLIITCLIVGTFWAWQERRAAGLE
ncbi:hypothetical protein [Brevundimonas sp.]|jgi:hypothetical protein|uniref:hypothetical protein n=1 Tax=Brevundimonas sp. TaxID=1871086 RepID=UPI0035B1F8EE